MTAKRLLIGFGLMLIVSGSYYYYTIQELIAYIQAGLIDQKDVWDRHLSKHENTYWFWYRAVEQFGSWLSVSIIFLIFILVLLVIKKNKALFAEIIGLFICVLGYTMPTVSVVKTMLFGMFFYGMVIILTAVAALEITRAVKRHQWDTGLGAAALIIVGVTAVMTFSDKQAAFADWMRADYLTEYNGVNNFMIQEEIQKI